MLLLPRTAELRTLPGEPQRRRRIGFGTNRQGRHAKDVLQFTDKAMHLIPLGPGHTLKRELQPAGRVILVGVQPSGCPWRTPAGESTASPYLAISRWRKKVAERFSF